MVSLESPPPAECERLVVRRVSFGFNEAVALLANDSYQCMHRVPGAAAGRLIGSYRAA